MMQTDYIDGALKLSKKVVDIDPLVLIYRDSLGQQYIYLGKFVEASYQFNEVIRLNPNDFFV
jgi:tetratricopeptide (TPR) repeat protein